jgi:hypothetical protein
MAIVNGITGSPAALRRFEELIVGSFYYVESGCNDVEMDVVDEGINWIREMVFGDDLPQWP